LIAKPTPYPLEVTFTNNSKSSSIANISAIMVIEAAHTKH